MSIELALAASLALHLFAYLCWMERDVFAQMALFRPLTKMLTPPVWSPPKRAMATVPTITFLEEPSRSGKRGGPRRPTESPKRSARPKDAKFY